MLSSQIQKKAIVGIILILVLASIVLIPVNLTMAKDKGTTITLMFNVKDADAFENPYYNTKKPYYYNVNVTGATVKNTYYDEYRNIKGLVLSYTKKEDLEITISSEAKPISPTGKTIANQTYDKDGWSQNTKQNGGFIYSYTSQIVYIKPKPKTSIMGTTFFLQLGGKSDGHGADASISDETNKVATNYNSKLVIIKKSKNSQTTSKWDRVKNKLSTFTDTITMISNMYLGLALIASAIILFINITRLAASPSHPIKRVAIIQDLVCCAVCIAGLGATWRITKMIVLLIAGNN